MNKALETPTILIGSLVRDREWILPRFLEAIHNIDYPKDRIDLYFIINDSYDESAGIIQGFLSEFGSEYNSCVFSILNSGAPRNVRQGKVRRKLYKTLAKLRNSLLDYWGRVSKADNYLSVDCDIIVNPNIVNKLLELDNNMSAAIIANHFGEYRIGNIMNIENGDFKHVDLAKVASDAIVEVDLSGACILFKRQFFLDNPSYIYADDNIGEDAGLHHKTYRGNHKIKAIKGLAEHIMRRDET